MNVLEVEALCKSYPAFALKNVSFSLEQGKITGFIGRNGAGKSTTLNALFHFVHPDSGRIAFFGMDILGHEIQIKQEVGFVSSGVNYYPTKKIKKITAVTKSFYKKWDEDAYARYMQLFGLDENKTPSQLSAGMKVKYALALALSHNAQLLILDEPTSGLDPVSREDLLEVFMNLCEEGKSILFSTHITSDLDKCADHILYIKDGEILAQAPLPEFVNTYKVLSFTDGQIPPELHNRLIGVRKSKAGHSALILSQDAPCFALPCQDADLESIMVHLEKEDAQ